MTARDQADSVEADTDTAGSSFRKVRDALADKRLALQARRTASPTPETLCLILGPYRNLTTLTAAVLGLHPECVVFNHGFSRVVRERSLVPFAPPDHPGFDRFLRFAAIAARHGRGGQHGGAIEASHAHERDTMQTARARAHELPRADPRVVVWKDSMRVTNHLRTIGLPPRKLTRSNPRVRCLLPIRNPLDCAISNVATYHGRYLATDDDRTPAGIIDPIVQEIGIFAGLTARYPESFLYFVEGDEPRKTFTRVAELLGLDASDAWLDLVELSWVVGSDYDHPPELVDAYLSAVDHHLTDHPELQERLRAFAG